MAKQNVKTMKGKLQYLTIKGDGQNQAMQGQPERLMYVATLITEKDSVIHKHMLSQIDAVWADYKKETGFKGKPSSNGIRPEKVKAEDGHIDDETGEVARVETGNVCITFKTGVAWPDGKSKVVKLYDGRGLDKTAEYENATWTIGNDSEGILHGVAQGNDAGGNHKVSLYLTAVQYATLKKYDGVQVELDDIGGEDVEFDNSMETQPADKI